MNLSEFKKSSYVSQPHLLLVGNPVEHSLSPLMHNSAAEYYGLSLKYHAVQVQPSEMGSFAAYLNSKFLKGVNVTIPYKQQMMDFVDELDHTARRIGALNTIVKSDGKLTGYNTDIYGFCKPLKSYQSEIESTRVIVFGTGGAARAIAFGLEDMGAEEVVLVSRNPHKIEHEKWPHFVQFASYQAWPEMVGETSLLVNATPLGMSPNTNKSPVAESQAPLLEGKICYDIVYNPMKTTFLLQAHRVGARTIGGLEMLIHQGSRAFELWTGKAFPPEQVRAVLKANI